MNKTTKRQELSPFAQTVEAALKNWQNLDKLGADSPLAAPYLLARYLDPQAMAAAELGKALKRLLEEALQAIDDKENARYQTIIRERYFNDRPEAVVCELIGLAKTAYHKSRKEAIEQLATVLMQRLTPALLLETPPRVQDIQLFGVHRELQPYLQSLEADEMIAIIGSGGVGKTTLGSQLAQHWDKTSVFWFTVRLGLNDHLNSMLFAFGYFLKTLGEPVLWQEVITQPRDFEMTRATEIVRHILRNLRQRAIKPLLCFDEVDLLQTAQEGTHAQLLAFIESLRNEAPVLLMGQQVLVDAHSFQTLEDLSLGEMQQMLAAVDIRLNPNANQLLHAYTHGNPRLIKLFITLQHDEAILDSDSLSDFFQQTQNIPPLEFFLHRIIRRLDQTECALLKALAVFRTSAPAELWQNKTTGWALKRLLQRHLVLTDQVGGVAILPAYRTIIYNLLTPEDRQQLHLSAAGIRAGRAAYTAAVYHLLQADQTEKALLLWRQHQQAEINQGQARSAHQIFRTLDLTRLSPGTQQLCSLFCAELAHLVGNPIQALHDIHSMLKVAPVLTIDAYKLEGEIENDQDHFSQAKERFKDAIKMAEALVETRIALSHKGIGWAMYGEADLEAAWRETERARYEIENFQGGLQEERCNYQAAEQLLRSAIDCAQSIDLQAGVAKTANNLAQLMAKQGRFEEARHFLIQADQCYKTVGKLTSVCGTKINWALMHNLAGEHEQALNALQQAFDLASAYGINLSSYQMAFIHLGRGEAYLGIADLTQAQVHTQLALDMEDDRMLPDGYRLMGEILREQNDLAHSEQFLQQSLGLLAQTNSYISGYAWRALAQTYVKAGKMREAQTAKAKAVELFEFIKLPYETKRTMKLLSHIGST